MYDINWYTLTCTTTHIPTHAPSHTDKSKEDYTLWSVYLVFIGVALPNFASNADSTYLPFFEGHENNAHCLAIAVNALAGAIFALYGEQHQRERMKEFLVVNNHAILHLLVPYTS